MAHGCVSLRSVCTYLCFSVCINGAKHQGRTAEYTHVYLSYAVSDRVVQQHRPLLGRHVAPHRAAARAPSGGRHSPPPSGTPYRQCTVTGGGGAVVLQGQPLDHEIVEAGRALVCALSYSQQIRHTQAATDRTGRVSGCRHSMPTASI